MSEITFPSVFKGQTTIEWGVLGSGAAFMYKLQIVNMLDEIIAFPDVVQFHASGLCHLAKAKFLLNTGETAFA